jgi:lactoylglutathione lyase
MFTSSMPNLYSADVAAAGRFYAELLGFSQTYQYPPSGEPRHIELRLGDSMVAISSHAAVREIGLPTPTPGHTYELVVWCDNVDVAVERLRSAGTPVLIDPHDHVAGHRRGYVADPDGNWLALVQSD